jgi:hypothetical protein
LAKLFGLGAKVISLKGNKISPMAKAFAQGADLVIPRAKAIALEAGTISPWANAISRRENRISLGKKQFSEHPTPPNSWKTPQNEDFG